MPQHPTEETLNITRKFLGGEPASQGQQGGGRREIPQPDPIGVAPARSRIPSLVGPPNVAPAGRGVIGPVGPPQVGSVGGGRSIPPLSNRFFDLPGPVGFSKTPQGQAILQRILGRYGRGGRRA